MNIFHSQDKIAESVTKMANVLERPMSSKQRQNLANALMGSIGAVLSSGSSDEAQSSNDTDQVKQLLHLLNELTGLKFLSRTPAFQHLFG